MAQLLVRNLDDDVKAKLKAQAVRNKMPLESLVREILVAAALRDADETEFGLGSRIAARFRGFDLAERELEPLPSVPMRPVLFDE